MAKDEKKEYKAVSFAPVQGFIEKSRKLRDLYGASLILSYLSAQVVEAAREKCQIISPGPSQVAPPHDQEGMPNRILIKGEFQRQDFEKAFLGAWAKVLEHCRHWLEREAFPKSLFPDWQFHWDADWLAWQHNTWELFWGHGENAWEAMRDLERRKLKRDWTGINWQGESSSLTGTDAIAWPGLGKLNSRPGQALSAADKAWQDAFYWRLAWVLDKPERRVNEPTPEIASLEAKFKAGTLGKYIAPNERLSIPELVKRLVTWESLAEQIGMPHLGEGFRDIYREPGYWTAWFMGDGDKVGDKLEKLSKAPDADHKLKQLSEKMRVWGHGFKSNPPSLTSQNSRHQCRIIYAGGDDFFGVLYAEAGDSLKDNPGKLDAHHIYAWLCELPQAWKALQDELKDDLELDYTYSVGVVWAAHKVPQRDILQHCREAEQRAKSLGRDRVTIRVVFNSGQYVQWTCPWGYLDVLKRYRDREGKTGAEANWAHLYGDWAQLKGRHAVRFQEVGKTPVEADLAIAILNLYFQDLADDIQRQRHRLHVTGGKTDLDLVRWTDDLIQVGWQLCSNS